MLSRTIQVPIYAIGWRVSHLSINCKKADIFSILCFMLLVLPNLGRPVGLVVFLT